MSNMITAAWHCFRPDCAPTYSAYFERRTRLSRVCFNCVIRRGDNAAGAAKCTSDPSKNNDFLFFNDLNFLQLLIQ